MQISAGNVMEWGATPPKSERKVQGALKIRAFLVERIAATLAIEPSDVATDRPFASFGLGSIDAVSLTGDLADWLGVDVDPTLAWDYPTIDALAGHLVEKQ